MQLPAWMPDSNLTPTYFCHSFWVRLGLLTELPGQTPLLGLKWLLRRDRLTETFSGKFDTRFK